MTICEIAIPIRRPDPKLHQEAAATCMCCGERYKSHVRRAGLTEYTCGCGVAYRVEALTVDAITCRDAVASANQGSFWVQTIQL